MTSETETSELVHICDITVVGYIVPCYGPADEAEQGRLFKLAAQPCADAALRRREVNDGGE